MVCKSSYAKSDVQMICSSFSIRPPVKLVKLLKVYVSYGKDQLELPLLGMSAKSLRMAWMNMQAALLKIAKSCGVVVETPLNEKCPLTPTASFLRGIEVGNGSSIPTASESTSKS